MLSLLVVQHVERHRVQWEIHLTYLFGRSQSAPRTASGLSGPPVPIGDE